MLFTSLSFGLFLPIVFILYWFILNHKLTWQNLLLLSASYFFYSCWDWRFAFLLAFSTSLDYYSGLMISGTKAKRYKKTWLVLSVIVNLTILGFFKYYNFFIDSFVSLFNHLGIKTHYSSLSIILPIGISFYTFHGLSYVFDIYNKKVKPSNSLIDYALFVSFFPLLVAGPVERATHLLPQIGISRKFDYSKAVDGLRQILWGLFKKVVIADGCAIYADQIFNNTAEYPGSTLFLGAILFTIQIYCDFSGYTDIALGTAKLFGFELLQNFKFPYFSQNIAEFWRRWHISLSSWFKDYLYIPLGGSKGSIGKTIRNIFIIFIISGFWHGANWTFIFWGFLNALFILPSIIFKTNRKNLESVAYGRYLPNPRELFNMTCTFLLTVFAWIFFRAENLNHAFLFMDKLFSKSLFSIPLNDTQTYSKYIIVISIVFMITEWFGREDKYAIEKIDKLINYKPLRWSIYSLISVMVLYSLNVTIDQNKDFIYFQF